MSKNTLLSTAQGINFLGYRHFHSGKILLRKSTARKIRKATVHSRIIMANYHGKLSWQDDELQSNYALYPSYGLLSNGISENK
jgi:hypothetical protein